MPVGPRFWLSGQSIWVARWGLPTSSKAQEKVPTVQVAPPPPEMDKELAWWFQKEEVVVEEARLGRDNATLEVVMEATGLLMQGQI